MIFFGPHYFTLDVCYIVVFYVLFYLVTDFLVFVQKIDPLDFSDAESFALRLSLINKNDSYIESAIIGSNHSFVVVSYNKFIFLIHLIPYFYLTFLDKNDFVDVV